MPGLRPSDIRVDKIAWRQPAILSFSGQGARFSGVDGTWLYHLSSVPANGALYDITDPLTPQRILMPWGTSVQFEEGPQARNTLWRGRAPFFTPQLRAHSPPSRFRLTWARTNLSDPSPSRRTSAVGDPRQQQGYQVVVVDVQDIYDAWNYGQVSPDAIRNFLRYAVHHWSPSPRAVVFVGDSTT